MFLGEEVSRKTHGVCFLGEKQEKNTNRKLIGMSRREKCVFGEEVSRKTHGVCFWGEKQARKHKPEAN